MQKHTTTNHNQALNNNLSKERIELYQTIQQTQYQNNHIKTSNLIVNKREQKLIKQITDIDNKQSTLQVHFKNTTPNDNPKTHMEQIALTNIIPADNNKLFGDMLKQKEKGITRIVL